ncbi:MAG: hypothetical protein IJC06_01575 [Clostridia bacterium]|nr:hypothetical protein [Clostridia bacterium]
MSIKRKYFSEENTPLAYYKVLKVLVIIWIIVSTCRFFSFMLEENAFGIIEMLITLTIHIIVAIGLYKKQWNGVVALYCMYLWYILDVLISLGIYISYGIADASTYGQTIGSIIGILIWAIPTWVYFSKRRLLFTPYNENKAAIYPATEPACEAGMAQQNRFCSECGEKLITDSKFCYKCGKEVICVIDKKNNACEKWQVCIFDVATGILRKEMRDVDVVKFPPSKFSTNNTYYAIETIKDNKKVRIYYEKNNWYKQIEKSLQTNV